MTIQKQQGAAAIYFIFIIGAIMSMGVLAIEGSRYIGKKARLGDAMEAASIAVAEADTTKNDFNEAKANHVATQWLTHLIGDSKNLDVTASRRIEEDSYGISAKSPSKFAYYRYDIHTHSTHESWFKFTRWPAFDKEVVVANSGAAGRMQSAPVDMVFVADFSDSMDNDQEGYKPNKGDDDDKIDLLKKIVKDVTNALHKNNAESSFAFIPFAKRIVIKRYSEKDRKFRFYCVSPLLSPRHSLFEKVRQHKAFGELVLTLHSKKDNHDPGIKKREAIYHREGFTQYERYIAEQYMQWIREYDDDDDKNKYNNGLKDDDLDDDCDDDDEYHPLHECRLQIYRYENNLRLDYNHPTQHQAVNWERHIDIKRTAREINITHLPNFYSPMPYDLVQEGKFGDEDGIAFERHCAEWDDDDDNVPDFYTIDRTTFKTQDQLDKGFHNLIDEMEEDSGTDVYQGLLAAPHQFAKATNKERVIVVLSDGIENNDMFKQLVDAGMCDTIRHQLKHHGKSAPYHAHLLFIKFSHKGGDEETDFYGSLPAYKKCFKDNIIKANDHADISDAILNYLTDDKGHNFYR